MQRVIAEMCDDRESNRVDAFIIMMSRESLR